MALVTLTIDNQEVKAEEGTTILQAAKAAGIHIPTLCAHDKLKPYSVCRICMVEIESRGRTSVDTSCSHPVENGIIVRTKTENIINIRRTLLELMMAHAPDGVQIAELAKEYGARRDLYEKDPTFCILCGLCVRYCNEVKGLNAIGFVDHGIRREVNFVPELSAKVCWDCKECFPLCPTSILQAKFLLTSAFMSPTAGYVPGQKE